MNKKIVFIDCDGTLVGCHEDGTEFIPNSAIQAIKKARKNNVLVYLCTGRSLSDIPTFLTSIGFDGIIGGSGAFIYENGVLIYHKKMSKEDVRFIIETLNSKKANYMLESNDGIYANKGMIDFFCSNLATAHFGNTLKPEKMANENEINKIVYISNDLTTDKVNAYLHNQYDVIGLSYGNNKYGGEISVKGISKGSAVENVLKRLQIDKENAYSIGDSYNDISMFNETKTSIAMKNCVEGLESIVDYTTTSLEKDGIYNAFVYFHLI